LSAAIACDDVAFERNTRVGCVEDAVAMGICFTREADEVANVYFAFHVVDACQAGDRNVQGIHQRGGYGGVLNGPGPGQRGRFAYTCGPHGVPQEYARCGGTERSKGAHQ